jgi:hypothetical protein
LRTERHREHRRDAIAESNLLLPPPAHSHDGIMSPSHGNPPL